jgi:hypothetical protein
MDFSVHEAARLIQSTRVTNVTCRRVARWAPALTRSRSWFALLVDLQVTVLGLSRLWIVDVVVRLFNH